MPEVPYWFGKGCRYFSGQWEMSCLDIPDYQNICTPELVFCNHVANPSKVEGNCNEEMCPVPSRKNFRFYTHTGAENTPNEKDVK